MLQLPTEAKNYLNQEAVQWKSAVEINETESKTSNNNNVGILNVPVALTFRICF